MIVSSLIVFVHFFDMMLICLFELCVLTFLSPLLMTVKPFLIIPLEEF